MSPLAPCCTSELGLEGGQLVNRRAKNILWSEQKIGIFSATLVLCCLHPIALIYCSKVVKLLVNPWTAQDKCFRQFRRSISPIIFAVTMVQNPSRHTCVPLCSINSYPVFLILFAPDLLSPLAAGSFGSTHCFARYLTFPYAIPQPKFTYALLHT
jgi:hypothetical protein